MERQSKGPRDLEAYCSGGQGPPRAVAPTTDDGNMGIRAESVNRSFVTLLRHLTLMGLLDDRMIVIMIIFDKLGGGGMRKKVSGCGVFRNVQTSNNWQDKVPEFGSWTRRNPQCVWVRSVRRMH